MDVDAAAPEDTLDSIIDSLRTAPAPVASAVLAQMEKQLAASNGHFTTLNSKAQSLLGQVAISIGLALNLASSPTGPFAPGATAQPSWHTALEVGLSLAVASTGFATSIFAAKALWVRPQPVVATQTIFHAGALADADMYTRMLASHFWEVHTASAPRLTTMAMQLQKAQVSFVAFITSTLSLFVAVVLLPRLPSIVSAVLSFFGALRG